MLNKDGVPCCDICGGYLLGFVIYLGRIYCQRCMQYIDEGESDGDGMSSVRP
jgi:hypothetical protein